MCKNWAHDALVLGLRAQESTKTAYLLRALSAVAKYRFFSNLVFYFIGIKYRSSMIELSILKKIGMRAQLTELTEETLFLRILGPSGLAQGLHGPNSCIFLISGIRPILLNIKTITVNFFLW